MLTEATTLTVVNILSCFLLFERNKRRSDLLLSQTSSHQSPISDILKGKKTPEVYGKCQTAAWICVSQQERNHRVFLLDLFWWLMSAGDISSVQLSFIFWPL